MKIELHHSLIFNYITHMFLFLLLYFSVRKITKNSMWVSTSSRYVGMKRGSWVLNGFLYRFGFAGMMVGLLNTYIIIFLPHYRAVLCPRQLPCHIISSKCYNKFFTSSFLIQSSGVLTGNWIENKTNIIVRGNSTFNLS